MIVNVTRTGTELEEVGLQIRMGQLAMTTGTEHVTRGIPVNKTVMTETGRTRTEVVMAEHVLTTRTATAIANTQLVVNKTPVDNAETVMEITVAVEMMVEMTEDHHVNRRSSRNKDVLPRRKKDVFARMTLRLPLLRQALLAW
jgi:hypothetical protein